MIKVGIIGGAGYTAGELIRLLLNHSETELDFIFSTSNAGNAVDSIHQDLVGSTDLRFTGEINSMVDVVFLCLGHGNSKAFLETHKFSNSTKIIDLSNDFRLKNDRGFEGKYFIYGLPELNKDQIREARFIANPGCFATSIQLALLPLANKRKLNSDIHVNAVTGSTGAGTALSDTTHFSWRDNNFSYYKAFNHQHLGEINESLNQLQEDFAEEVIFVPNRGNFSRGIFATAYLNFEDSLAAAQEIFQEYYESAAFTHISEKEVHMKQVVNTNNCLIHLHKHQGRLLISSAIDNLLKGASGQAIQNMNLMFGFDEKEGLKLKGSYF